MNRLLTQTLEVDVTFRVALDRDDVRERSRLPDVYRSPDVFRLPAKTITGRGPVRSCSGREPVSRQKNVSQLYRLL